MKRLCTWIAPAALALLLAPAATAAPTTIATVAGGGDAVGVNLAPATGTKLNFPVGLARIGLNGDFALLPDKDQCVVDHVVPDPGSDTGPIYLDAGTGSCTSSSTPFDGTQFGLSTSLANPCCVAQWGSGDGILLANSGVGRVEGMDYHDFLFLTYIGDTKGCAGAPPDNVARTAVHLCTISAMVAHPTDQTRVLIAETGRTDGGGDEVYELSGGNIHHVAGGGCTTGSATPAFNLCLSVSGLSYSGDASSFLISDYQTSGVWKVSTFDPTTASVTHFAGGVGSPTYGFVDNVAATSGKLNHPYAISPTYDGGYLIADAGNCRIRKVNAGGTISTIAGSGCGGAELGDGGPSTSATLNDPRYVVMTPGGALISDSGHDRVRLVNRTSILSGPAALTKSSHPEFTFASLDDTPDFKCSLNDGTTFDCPSPYTLAVPSDGPQSLKVWEGNAPADPTPAVAAFTVDSAPPQDLALTSPDTDSTVTSPRPAFTWHQATDATTAVAGYELVVDGTKAADVPTSACAQAVCSASAPNPIPNGPHNWTVRALDTAGNAAEPAAKAFVVAAAPAAAFTIAPNPAGIGRKVVFDASASAGDTAISHYEWDLNGDGSFETDGGTSPQTSATYPVAGTYNVTLRVTDAAGLQSTATQSLRVTALNTPDVQFGVTINDAARYTNDPNVTLKVVFPLLTSSILVSNDGGFGAPSPFLPVKEIKWKLDSSGPERLPKTVYVRFLPSLIAGLTFTDDIILDETPPTVQQAALAPGAAGKAASAAKAKTYVVKVKARDSNSGVGKVQVAVNKKKPGKLVAYKAKVKVKSSGRPKFLRAQDRAGNFSAWKKLR